MSRFAILIALVLLPVVGAAEPQPAPADTQRVRLWREDLRFFDVKLREIHPKPFFRVSAATFDSARAALDARIPELSDAEIAVELKRLGAMIRDGHTSVGGLLPGLGFDSLLPIRAYPFEDGLSIIAAAAPYERLAGAKVVRIGTLAAAEALERVGALASADNDFARLDRSPLLLMSPRVLEVLGIVPDAGRVSLELDLKGKRERVQVTPLAAATDGQEYPSWYFDGEGLPGVPWRAARDTAAAKTALHLRQPLRPWWYEHLPAERAVYFQFRSVTAFDGGRSFEDFCRELFAFVDSVQAEKLVIDIRHNHGGNNMIVQPLIHGLIRRDRTVNRRGHLFVVIGRGTFSAGMNTANWLEEHTHALFVGEPTGSSPNSYGDAQRLELPHHGLPVFVSAWPWSARLPWDARPWIAPHLPAPMTFADYRANRDPALEAALAYRPQPSLGDQLRDAARAGGYEAALATQRAYKAIHPDRWGRTTAREAHGVGRDLLQRGETEAAIAVMRVNVEAYPEFAILHEHLAEAYLKQGDRNQAAEQYRRVLAIDPGSRTAKQALDKLATP